MVLQTIVQYFILIFIMVAGFLFISSIPLQDWMREEFKVKLPKETVETMYNDTLKPLMPNLKLPNEVDVLLKAHCGLQRTCIKYTLKGLGNPIDALHMESRACVENDFFIKPTKYGLPKQANKVMKYFKEEASALENARICMILAILMVVLALLVVLIKAFKWQKESVLATTVFVSLSCICVVAALGLLHSKFKFEEDFNTVKAFVAAAAAGQGSYSRQRRDDGSTGYGDKYGGYNFTYPSTGEWESGSEGSSSQSFMKSYMAELQKQVMKILPTVELKESIGSPLVMAGLGVGFLLLTIIMNGLEFYLIKKHGGLEIKYQNVELVA